MRSRRKPGTAAFFRAWTGKEAILKAEGVGLFGGVQEISIPLDDEEQAATLDCAGRSIWRLTRLGVPDGYVGAVACDDVTRTVHVRDYAF